MQQNFDSRQLMKLAQSPAGQQLMQALSRSGTADLQKAASLASEGNLDQAKQALSSLLADPNIRSLLAQLEEQL